MYKKILKPILFHFDPEHVHDFFVSFGIILGLFIVTRWIVRIFCHYDNPILYSQVAGIKFKNLNTDKLDVILNVVDRYPFIDGFVVGNLSKRREKLHLISSQEELNVIPQGGISELSTKNLSTALIRHIYKKIYGKYVIIGLGGIFTAEDTYEKIKAGAWIVQIITGLIYGGPQTVKRINKGLVEFLKSDGYANIAEAVGKET